MRPTPLLLALGALLALACSNAPAPSDGGADATADAGADAAADAGADAGGLPDLWVDATELENNVQFTRMYFPPTACEIAEGCVAAPGWRTLLMFTTVTPNTGTADLVFGPNVLPGGTTNPDFEYSMCHMHYHFRGYADYSLVNTDGTVAAIGHKQSFCVEDLYQYDTADPTVSPDPVYGNCGDMGGMQGVSRGWADDYYPNLPCQWIDVTDVAPGAYTLRVELNGMHRITELDYTNDTAEVPVTIPAGVPTTDPTHACTDSDPYQGSGRNCGWQREGVHTCTPGERVSVGCNDACGVGSCDDSDGGYDVRICRGDLNCNSTDAVGLLANDFGECGTGVFDLNSDCGVARFTCPTEGQYTVLVAGDISCAGDGDCYLAGEHCVAGRCVDASGSGYSGCHLQTVLGTPGTDAGTTADAGVDGG